jgi:HlyD family secretion protein
MLQKTPAPETTAKPDVERAEPDIAAILKAGAAPSRARRYIIPGLVLAAVALALWLAFGGAFSTATVTYTTATVTRGDLTVTVTATGTVQPTNVVEISSELSGTVESVNADFNDIVARGETLATLKTDKLDANVIVGRASVTAREADLLQAEVTEAETAAALDRSTQLQSRGVVTEQSLDAARAVHDRAAAALAVARANLATAEANLSISETDRGKAAILSPIDGVVLSRSIETGQTIAASLQAPILFTLAEDLARMQLEVDVDEADIGSVSEDDAATFSVAAFQDRTFPARIAQVRFSPATVEGVVTYKAILTVDNADLSLRPGMTATASIVVDEIADTLLVPNAALRYAPAVAVETGGSGGGFLGLLMPSRPQSQSEPVVEADGRRTIWVLRDGAPVAVSVRTGLTDGSHTAVTEGELSVGDLVIVGARTAS